jgi:hypothetical protein
MTFPGIAIAGWFQIIPKTAVGINARSLYSEPAWDRYLTYRVRGEDPPQCDACLKECFPETHEEWDIQAGSLKLLGFLHLCSDCHKGRHGMFLDIDSYYGRRFRVNKRDVLRDKLNPHYKEIKRLQRSLSHKEIRAVLKERHGVEVPTGDISYYLKHPYSYDAKTRSTTKWVLSRTSFKQYASAIGVDRDVLKHQLDAADIAASNMDSVSLWRVDMSVLHQWMPEIFAQSFFHDRIAIERPKDLRRWRWAR